MMSAMTYRGLPRPLLGLVAAAVVLTSTGCVRIETPPPPSRTASAVTLERDLLADSLDEVALAIAQEEATTLAGAVEAHSIEALVAGVGPRYVAFPDPTASPSPSPVAQDVATAAADALQTSLEIAETTPDEELRAWAVSATLVHALAVWLDSVEAASGAVDAGPRGLPLEQASETALPESTGLDPAALADLALRHDQARYLYELASSRVSGEARTAALARAAVHADRSDALQSLSDAPDARTEVYSTLAASIQDDDSRAATLRGAETSVGSAYAAYAIDASPDDLRWLLDGAFDAYTESAQVDGWTLWELPVLPGLEDPAPAVTEE
ncbi:hypothetical protein [Demequina zhanjiangensis]|uniref:DUF4439 domain-containing protein n=1 Tax=Demequina zhanjiangensis TaxID=3051659 RepID=A0ABT8G393_9MICO|nr:hypothetical protein [Demequina sp. SYSU T00b26]MDN4473600.1 hypothetical protein [Demequina sp. SYSU T00b26]